MTDSTKPSTLTKEQAQALAQISVALRKRIRQQIKQMQTLPEQHLSAVIR